MLLVGFRIVKTYHTKCNLTGKGDIGFVIDKDAVL